MWKRYDDGDQAHSNGGRLPASAEGNRRVDGGEAEHAPGRSAGCAGDAGGGMGGETSCNRGARSDRGDSICDGTARVDPARSGAADWKSGAGGGSAQWQAKTDT